MSLLLLATSFPWALFHLLSTSQSTTAIARRGRNSLAIAHPSRGRSPRRHDAACLHSTRRRMSLASSSSSKGLENDDGDSTTTATMTVVAPKAPPPSSPPPSTSSRARSTLDPCVILMKRMISKHAHKWEAEGGIHSLAQGVVHWRPPDSAYEALNDAVRENVEMTTTDNDRSDGGAGGGGGDGGIVHTYCPDEGYPPLLAALGEKLRDENGLRDPHVIVTSGANQAYVNCVLALLDEVDDAGNRCKCVVFSPYYFNHVMAVQSVRGDGGLLVGPTVRGVPDLGWLRARLEEHDYSGGVDSASEGERGNAVGNAIRMVTLVNPGNPTGVSLPYAFLEEMMRLTKQYGVWLVVDNTYEHFDVEGRNRLPDGSGGDHDRHGRSWPDFPCFDEEHVINIFSFSKGYAMAGFRVGYVALSSKNGNDSNDGNGGKGTRAYEEMLKVQDTIAICTSRISQMAALGAMRSGRDWVYDRVRTLDAGRAAILGAMSSLKDVIGGNGAMYVMGKLPDGVDDQEFASSLVEHYGVAVIPGSFCGLPGWIRICYSNLDEVQCGKAASRLEKGISELTSRKR